jgi:DNA-binding SARP family transcriptional activator/tetratricopeptide (TPR) repeat protein
MTDPTPIKNGSVRVRLLGGFEVEGVAERDLGSRKARTLLKVLALAGGSPVSVHRIAEILWGDKQPSRPADQVGVLVSRLRRVLGAERIIRSDAGYVLTTDWLDVSDLRGLAAVAAEARAEGRAGAARAAADAALLLARGPLLPDEDGEWVEAERAAVGAAISEVQRLAVDAAVASGDLGAAAALAEQALASDPYDEVVLRALMDAHLVAGRPASALAAYARVRHRLAEELGVSPTADTEDLHARALAAADGDTAAAAPPRRGAPAGVVGRGDELAALDTALSQAARGGVALVVVEGDAGIGKTTLVDAWSRVVDHEAVVLRGRCDELGRDLPLQPVSDALADHLRIVGAEGAAALVGDDATTLAALLGPATGSAATVVADADAARNRVFSALVAVLARAGSERPTALVIEDLHLAGAGTLAWLAFARRRGRRTLLVVTTRPGGGIDLDATHRIHLGPLDRDAVVELVGAHRAGALYERSGGHPLLLAALAASDDEELPATLLDVVAARVDSLGDHVATTLRVAAVVGPDCDLELVAQVGGTPVVDVLAHLEAAAQAGLIVERGSRFAFRHQLVREALEAATGAARRAFVHRQAARASAARPHPDSLAVAVHARAGGDTALASSSFVDAAAAAEARFDLDAAEDHLAAALDLVPTPDAHAARAQVRMSRLALEAAATDAERAIALGGGAPALEVAGWVAYYQRRYDDALAYAEGAAARATDDAVRVSALALAGRVRHGAGDLAGAVEHLTAVGGGPPAVRGIADVWLAQARLHQGRPAEALAALSGPMVDPDSLAHPWAHLHLRFNRILALGQLGRVSDALRVVADLDAVVEREGAIGARFAAPAANAGAWILRWSGRGDEADDRNQQALDATGGDTGPCADALAEGHYVALLDLADGCLLRGDASGAADLAQRLEPVDTWGGTMAWHQRHRLGLLRARLALADGDGVAAAGLAAVVADDAAGRGAERYELLGRAVIGLADPSIPPERLAPVIDGLGRCAMLDGWPLVAALAATRRSDPWRADAERRAAAVVAGAGAHGDAARRFVDRVLTA